ncbi:MAG TPA: pilus assembly protein TadG-related protein, partial [Gemmataceae bacterium]|nr:pilus assembly protein TadG-related protein [Gemmataceae bacterium]
MIRKSNGDRRKGTILPLAAVSLVSVCGFVALAFDIGLIAVAKTQCQNSADAASMAGARTLDGTPGQNLGPSTPPYTAGTAYGNAYAFAEANLIINSPPTSVQIQMGAWHYDTSKQLFTPNFPPVSPDNYNLCQ